MLNKCLKCGEPGHRLNDFHPKNLSLIEVKVGESEVNNIKDGNDKEALELEANGGILSNNIVHKILLAPKLKWDN